MLKSVWVLRLALATAFVACIQLPSIAQVIPDLPYSGTIESYFQSWDLKEAGETTRITQTVVPIGVYLPVSPGLDLRLSSSFVSMSRELDQGGTQSVNGLTDVKVQAAYGLLHRRLMIGLTANLPTGAGELSQEEQDVVFSFVAPDLSVRANRLGEGFNVGGSISYAYAVSRMATLGLSAAVIRKGTYDTALPVQPSTVSLQPGLEARFASSVQIDSEHGFLSLTGSYAFYGNEQVEDVEVYRVGPEFSATVDARRPFLQSKGITSLRFLMTVRGDNEVLNNGTLQTEPLSTNGNYFVAAGGVAYRIRPAIQAGLSATGRFAGANDFDANEATVVEIGLNLGYRVSDSVSLGSGIRFITGSGTNEAGLDREITGVEAGFRTSVRLSP